MTRTDTVTDMKRPIVPLVFFSLCLSINIIGTIVYGPVATTGAGMVASAVMVVLSILALRDGKKKDHESV